ncbi:Dabb family protein [Nocardia nova]|uniref:Dabb family protein n=1 Tax=Nocardia nova TaxID=37330 RepID=UPI0007A38CBB|nr:Dabb family protein [Nocardia nova]MBV7702921.1 Dabb family protein [Nocardia nova]PPI99919.1 Dabb family protein [Nocardia nova]
MYKVTRLLHLDDTADRAAVLRTITSAADAIPARYTLVAPTLPGARNGGDLLVHLQFESESEWSRWRAPIDAATSGSSVHHVDAAEYRGGSPGQDRAGRRNSSSPASVYRTLLLRVDDSASPAELGRFEHAMLQMPVHLPGIRAWQLSRVAHASGTSAWTHVWEQEFADLDTLLGPYMNHPVHWGHVDRWFDPECPEQLVKDRVCHSFCAMSAPVITDTTPAALSAAEER